MDLGYWPPLPMGLISVAARDVGLRAARFTVATQRHLPRWPAAAVLGAVAVAASLNAADWGQPEVRFLIAISLSSLVATSALAIGWSAEPEKLERWAARALLAAFASALPALSWA